MRKGEAAGGNPKGADMWWNNAVALNRLGEKLCTNAAASRLFRLEPVLASQVAPFHWTQSRHQTSAARIYSFFAFFTLCFLAKRKLRKNFGSIPFCDRNLGFRFFFSPLFLCALNLSNEEELRLGLGVVVNREDLRLVSRCVELLLHHLCGF